MIKQFQVEANAAVFGVYEAEDAQGARDACAVDAGYKSEADMDAQLGQASELVAIELTGALEIVEQFAHLNDTDAGRKAVAEYERAREAGKCHVLAEVLASNVLQLAGYNVNTRGGVSIRRAVA